MSPAEPGPPILDEQGHLHHQGAESRAVRELIVVRITIQRVASDVDLAAVVQAVTIGIRVGRVGADVKLATIVQAVTVGVVVIRVTPEPDLDMVSIPSPSGSSGSPYGPPT